MRQQIPSGFIEWSWYPQNQPVWLTACVFLYRPYGGSLLVLDEVFTVDCSMVILCVQHVCSVATKKTLMCLFTSVLSYIVESEMTQTYQLFCQVIYLRPFHQWCLHDLALVLHLIHSVATDHTRKSLVNPPPPRSTTCRRAQLELGCICVLQRQMTGVAFIAVLSAWSKIFWVVSLSCWKPWDVFLTFYRLVVIQNENIH